MRIRNRGRWGYTIKKIIDKGEVSDLVLVGRIGLLELALVSLDVLLKEGILVVLVRWLRLILVVSLDDGFGLGAIVLVAWAVAALEGVEVYFVLFLLYRDNL